MEQQEPKETKELEISDSMKIVVGLYENNGTSKLQLSRKVKSDIYDWSFRKLGRLTKVEVQKVIQALQELEVKM